MVVGNTLCYKDVWIRRGIRDKDGNFKVRSSMYLNPSFTSKIFNVKISKRLPVDKYKYFHMESSYFWSKKYHQIYASKIWNSMPYHIKNLENLEVFKTIIKKWYGVSCNLDKCYVSLCSNCHTLQHLTHFVIKSVSYAVPDALYNNNLSHFVIPDSVRNNSLSVKLCNTKLAGHQVAN